MSEDGSDLIGKILLGKLEVIRVLGGGGMGLVYEVKHRLTGHRRALKLVRAKFSDRPRFMKRLLREAKVAGTLGTPYVVETYDAGRLEDGSAYVLMELLDGRTLYDVTRELGRLEALRMGKIMAQLAEGVAVAHEAGIIHRDLKPENVFLVKDADGVEKVKILDFGVSKFTALDTDEAPSRLTAEGTLVGTPYYMSPEQAAGRPVDARSDVYAMGVMIYEAITGRLPFEADSVGALFVKIGAGDCVPMIQRRPDLNPEWSRIAHKAFDRDPDQRYQTAEEFRRDLLPLLQGGTTGARARTISDRPLSEIATEPLMPGVRLESTDAEREDPAPLDWYDYEEETKDAPRDRVDSEEDTEAGPGVVAALELSGPTIPETTPPSGVFNAPQVGSKGPPAWTWGIVGAAIALLILVPIALLQRPDPAASQPPAPAAAEIAPPVVAESDANALTVVQTESVEAEDETAESPEEEGEAVEATPEPRQRRRRRARQPARSVESAPARTSPRRHTIDRDNPYE